MSNHKNIRTSSDPSSPIPTQNHSPDKPYYSLDAFYATLLSRTFKSNTEAIIFCRDLCSNHGFTVKQEQSTHKNIYVYCSREGLPDSHRNPKVNPQRNRQSQRCECRWRIVLFENNKETWEFRKSQNADAYIHNHPLLKPEEIKKEWPREVSEKIFELARQRLPTNEIRQQVREQYPDISWDDRRFYNRLSEERQKMKQRDTAMRTIRLVNLSAQICMVNAGSEDLSHYVESKLVALLEDTCKFANVDSSAFPMPIPLPFTNSPTSGGDPVTPSSINSAFSVSHEDIDNHLKKASNMLKNENQKRDQDSSSANSPREDNDSRKPSFSHRKSFETLPKGFLAVPIPEHTFHVKMYSQNSVGDIRRAIFDMQRPTMNAATANPNNQYALQPPRRRRSRAMFSHDEDPETMDLDIPARKLSRQVASSLMDDELDDISTNSSPSNSQTMLFSTTTTNTPGTHDMNHLDHHHHQQHLMSNPYSRIPTSSASAADNLFYGNSNENSNRNLATENNNYIHQSSFSTQADNIYPSANLDTNAQARQQLPQHMMYDPTSFVQQSQQQQSQQQQSQQQQQQQQQQDMGLMSSPSTPQHVQHERPHSMTFGAALPIRGQPVSISRISSIENQPMMRPLGYPPTFTQLHNIIDDNEVGKQRYYPYRDPLQQPASPLPPRPSSAAAAISTSSSSSSQIMQQYLPPHQQTGAEVFASYQLNPSQPSPPPTQNLFSGTFMATNEQALKQQKPNQPYNLGYASQTNQEQHMYRRASGPN